MIDSPVRRVLLVNPGWDFSGSRYWSCQDPHLPLELLYTQEMLKEVGIDAQVLDAHLEKLSLETIGQRAAAISPDLIVLTTAPSYLFWRCPQPELDVPAAAAKVLGEVAPVVAIGPHGSSSPGYVIRELGCAGVIRGEAEEEVVRLAQGAATSSTVWSESADDWRESTTAAVKIKGLPALTYEGYPLHLRTHRHHVFWGEGRGAEVEFSRGCPYGCNFCNRRFFRKQYRERPLEKLLAELRTLRDAGIDYVYFIDELFGHGRCQGLLDALASEKIIQFGCETRLDLWDEKRLDRLAAAGCISVEFGLESPFPDVQTALNKGYRIDGDRAVDLMVYAKEKIPWVQGDMLEPPGTNGEMRKRTEEWRQAAIARGVWLSDPINIFLYPGCDLHDQLIGPVDDLSWIRAREESKR